MPTFFKQKCMKCKKNFVLATRRDRFVVCYDCQKDLLQGNIKDPEAKKMFAIPEQYLRDSTFLRDIKIQYLRYGKLTEKQQEAFKKVVAKMKADEGKPKEPI